MTAGYATRATLLTFHGPPRSSGQGADPQPGMLIPLLALVIPAALLGFLGGYRGWLPFWVSSVGTGEPHAVVPGALTAVLSFVLLVAGVALVYFVWVAHPQRDPLRMVGPLRTPFARGFFADALYDLVIVRGVAAAGRGTLRVDTDGIDATVVDSGRLARWLGALVRRTQTGNMQWYVTCVVVGAVALAVGAVVLT
ncbi:MAG: hypothetical protein GEV00_23205 [Actinophytocola sp.]|nr:hypothetical protein [Actinophytocola sp.]